MTDEKLKELEAACSGAADGSGTVRLHPGDILDLIGELRELRTHAADLSLHEGAIANLHRLLANLGSYRERQPDVGFIVSGHIAVQDPGR